MTELPDTGVYSLTPGKGLIFEVTLDNLLTKDSERVAPIILPFSQDPVNLNEDFVDTLSLSKSGQDTVSLFDYYCANCLKRQRGGCDALIVE